jgi:hypothetical protein
MRNSLSHGAAWTARDHAKRLPRLLICGIVSGMQYKTFISLSSVLAVVLTYVSGPPATVAQNQRLKPEELIAKHLDSIATAEKRKAVRSRTTSGTAQVSFRIGGRGTMDGKANILSQGTSVRAGLNFAALEYPGEQIAFNGTKVTAGMMSPGNYPPFSGFVYEICCSGR